MRSALDPAWIEPGLDSRAVSFENPTGERGAGGRTHAGRKGAPSRRIEPGKSVVLADLEGPGRLRHFWMTVPPAPPEVMRALLLEVYYDDLVEPSVSVPCLDFFGLPHGRPVAFDSLLASTHEGRGFNLYAPLPFNKRVRVEFTNAASRAVELYYQIDYTLESWQTSNGYLHATFRRENPTTQQRDFVILEGLRGPGRFLGCNVGIRVLDEGMWYGEGEVKVFRDGDTTHPTICGTGLEDYVGTAWGMGTHSSTHAGSPLNLRRDPGQPQPDFLSFYRWHVLDPIVFTTDCRVTIQQIGAAIFGEGQEEAFQRYAATHRAAGGGWRMQPRQGVHAFGIAERVDDYCATAFVYCRQPQPVTRVDLPSALADIERLGYEQPHPFEGMLAG